MNKPDIHKDKLRQAEEQIKKREEYQAERKIQKEMDQMEKKGFYDNPDKYTEEMRRTELLEEFEVFETKEDKNGNIIKTGKINNIRLGNAIMNMGYYFKRVYDDKTGQDDIYYYKDGYYRPGGEEIIRGLAGWLLGDFATDHRRTEALKHIRYLLENRIERTELEPDPKYINCNNGIYNIETGELIPHSPGFYFINKIPVNYDPAAECPKIEKFFSEVLYPDDIPLIEEIGGDILHRKKLQHVFFVFLGGGRNGKGVTIQLFSKMIGDNNFSTRNLNEFNDDRFAKGDLYGKMANFGSELSSKYIDDSAAIKNISGGEPITGERKYKGTFSYVPYATMIANANQLPGHKDHTLAFYQRWIIVPFPNSFLRGEKNTNPNLINELTTPEELSGLLNIWIKGLKRLLENNDFSYEDNDEIPKYEKYAYPVYAFIENYLENVTDVFKPTDKVYNKYVKWAKDNKFQVETKTAFTRTLKHKFKNPPVETGVKKIAGKSTRCYININWKLKDEATNNLDNYNFESEQNISEQKSVTNTPTGGE